MLAIFTVVPNTQGVITAQMCMLQKSADVLTLHQLLCLMSVVAEVPKYCLYLCYNVVNFKRCSY